MEAYVSSSEGMKLLGVPRNKFFYHVEKGEISILEGQTVRHNRYSVADILALKKRLREQRIARKPQPAPLIIDWIRPEDIPSGLRLAQQVYPDDVDLAELAVYQSWRKNNNQISMGAFSLDRQECFAAIQLVPLSEAVILDVLAEVRSENSIQPDEIRSFDAPGAYTLLATSAIARADRPTLLYRLLYRYMEFWIEQFPERYIDRIYAQAVSDKGEMLVQHFFMLPRWDLAPNAFMLDMYRPSASKIVRWFQARLKEKAPLPAVQQQLPMRPPITPAIAQHPQHQPVVWEDVNAAQRAKMPNSTETAKATSPPQKTATYATEPQKTVSTGQPPGTITLQELAERLHRSQATLKGHFKSKYDDLPDAEKERSPFHHIRVPIPARPGQFHHYFTGAQADRIAAWIEAHTK